MAGRRIEHDGRGNLLVRFPFDRRLVDLVKTLPGRRWNPARKHWSVPDGEIVEVAEVLAPEGFAFDEASRALYAQCGGTLALEGDVAPAPGDPSRRLFDDPAGENDAVPRPGDLTVGELNRRVREAIETAFPSSVWVVGEISGFDKAAHRRIVGFQLVERDEDGREVSKVQATLFEDVRREIERALAAGGDPFAIADEITVRVLARVDLYEPWGQYRLRIEGLDIAYTLGEAARRREEIVRLLTEAGLVGRNTSLPFPDLPLRVGLVTSLNSDACNDVLRHLEESGFAFEVTAHGARVQGRATEPSVLNALDWFRERADAFDVVLVCRGGGSRTDLAWFDSEALGRAVATFPLPVVVGIGHEQDQSVLDAVGWRAKTPTAAAEMLVGRVASSSDRVEQAAARILEGATARLRAERRTGRERARRLASSARRLLDGERREQARRAARIPRAAGILVERRRAALAGAVRQLAQGSRRDLAAARRRILDLALACGPGAARRIDRERERTLQRERRLWLVDPRRVVERGYAVLRGEDGRVVADAASAPPGSLVRAELKRGVLRLRSEGKDV